MALRLTNKPTAAFVLSLVAGLFILLGGGVRNMMSLWFRSGQGPNPFYGGMMGGYGGYEGSGGYGWMSDMMSGYGYGMMGGFSFLGILGLLFGIVVILSAVMLYSRPREHTTWGVLILVFSALSPFGSMMGGFGVGVLLGVIGGILAVTWKS